MAVFSGQEPEGSVQWRRSRRSLTGSVAACLELGTAMLWADGTITLGSASRSLSDASGEAPVILRSPAHLPAPVGPAGSDLADRRAPAAFQEPLDAGFVPVERGHAARLRGGAGDLGGDIVDDWETQSKLPVGYRRSKELRQVDETLAAWRDDDGWHLFGDPELERRRLEQILSAIQQWSDSKQDRLSKRDEAVGRLRRRIESELSAVAGPHDARVEAQVPGRTHDDAGGSTSQADPLHASGGLSADITDRRLRDPESGATDSSAVRGPVAETVAGPHAVIDERRKSTPSEGPAAGGWESGVLPVADADAPRAMATGSGGPAVTASDPVSASESALPRSVEEWLDVWAPSGIMTAIEHAEALVSAAGPVPEQIEVLRSALEAIDDWRSDRSSVEDPRGRRRQAVDALAERLQGRLEQLLASAIRPMPLTGRGVMDPASGDDHAPVSQRMVPSGRDLELARHLMEPGAVEPFSDELARHDLAASDAPPRGADSAYAQALSQRRRNIVEDRSIFEAMLSRTDWTALRPPQVAALVLAERRGRAVAERERGELINRLVSGRWVWTEGYPLAVEKIDALIDGVHDFLRDQMIITINIYTPMLGKILRDSTIAVKNTWMVSAHDNEYQNGRGEIEEFLGYAASVKRNIEAGGIYRKTQSGPQVDIFDSDPHFSPAESDRGDLPKYAALVSPRRPMGGIPRYGDIVFHLKSDVRGRATFTPKDSFEPGLGGARGVTGPDRLWPLLVHGDEAVIRLAFAEATDFAFDPEMRMLVESGNLEKRYDDKYFEAQIHGDITWGDIDHIVIVAGKDADADRKAQRDFTRLASDNGYEFGVKILSSAETREAPPKA